MDHTLCTSHFFIKELPYMNEKFNDSVPLSEQYLIQRRADQEEGRIKDYNFSGDQVREKLKTKYSRLNKIFDSLQLKDDDVIIWISGYYGLTLAFKKRVSSVVLGSVFDQFIIFMVIMNTVGLAM